MKPDKTIQTWEITLLTPLHVGDGENLVLNMDYVHSGNKVFVYHIDAIIESISDNPRVINDMGRMLNLEKFIKNYKLDIKPEYVLPSTGNSPREIRRFLKNAYGEPYIAGSTLKGAIRTALWNTLDRSKLPAVNNFRQFEKEVKNLDGQPHNDFLRPLSISDSCGLNPQDSLQAQEVKIFNVLNGNRPGWKDFATRARANRDRFEDVEGIFVEALRPSTRFHVRFELNDFLQKTPVNSLWQIPNARGLRGIEDLAGVVNDHSQRLAEREREFFAEFGQACVGAIRFYDELIQKGFDEIRQISGAFILRMAWSSGWKGMTGEWIESEDLEPVRRENNLGKNFCPQCRRQIYSSPKKGKYFCKSCRTDFTPSELELSPVFPKTRRLAMKDGIPSQPMGWIMVSPSSDSFFTKTARLACREKEPEVVLLKTETSDEISQARKVVSPIEKPDTPEEPVRETWENVHLVRTPQNDTIAATLGNKKAFVIGKELVPERLHKLLFGKKKSAAGQKVEVEAVGNAFKIVKIY